MSMAKWIQAKMLCIQKDFGKGPQVWIGFHIAIIVVAQGPLPKKPITRESTIQKDIDLTCEQLCKEVDKELRAKAKAKKTSSEVAAHPISQVPLPNKLLQSRQTLPLQDLHDNGLEKPK